MPLLIRVGRIPQLIELAVPALFLYLLGLIKGTSKPERFGGDVPLADTPVPTYDDLQTFASHPNVLCYDNNLFFRYENVCYRTVQRCTFTAVRDGPIKVETRRTHSSGGRGRGVCRIPACIDLFIASRNAPRTFGEHTQWSKEKANIRCYCAVCPVECAAWWLGAAVCLSLVPSAPPCLPMQYL